MEFIQFLEDWKKATPKGASQRLTHQTHLGLIVSLKGTLQLVDFLTAECGFEYLMTRRINQDSLEVGVIKNGPTVIFIYSIPSWGATDIVGNVFVG